MLNKEFDFCLTYSSIYWHNEPYLLYGGGESLLVCGEGHLVNERTARVLDLGDHVQQDVCARCR